MTVLSCQTEEPFIPIYDVPLEFQQHVMQFINEANNRGQRLEIDDLTVLYDELDISICATCNSSSLSPTTHKVISINASKCWLNDVQLEALIFHEMAHCFLGRDHNSELLPNGDPKSMMIANDISIYSPCVYAFGGDDCNQLFKRVYYLDELFDETTQIPDWAE